jgi:hypothetical protein
MKIQHKIKSWLHGLVILTVFIWLVAAISARADDTGKYTYVFAEIQVVGAPYYVNVQATYFSQVVRVPADRVDDFKEAAREAVQKLIQGQNEKISKNQGKDDNEQVVRAGTATDAGSKRDHDMDGVKMYPYAPGNTVKTITVKFGADD